MPLTDPSPGTVGGVPAAPPPARSLAAGIEVSSGHLFHPRAPPPLPPCAAAAGPRQPVCPQHHTPHTHAHTQGTSPAGLFPSAPLGIGLLQPSTGGAVQLARTPVPTPAGTPVLPAAPWRAARPRRLHPLTPRVAREPLGSLSGGPSSTRPIPSFTPPVSRGDRRVKGLQARGVLPDAGAPARRTCGRARLPQFPPWPIRRRPPGSRPRAPRLTATSLHRRSYVLGPHPPSPSVLHAGSARGAGRPPSCCVAAMGTGPPPGWRSPCPSAIPLHVPAWGWAPVSHPSGEHTPC